MPTIPFPQSDKTGWPWSTTNEPLPERMPDSCEWPKISIVTPSYNQAQYLEETIRSVLLQGYPNLEYIIIDGGSTDGSVEIIKKYEPWLTYWVSEPDNGQSHAINKGWEKSTGDLLAWINSDDYLSQSALLQVANEYRIIDKEKTGIIHGKSMYIDADGNELGERGVKFDLLESVKKSIQLIPQPSIYFTKTSLLMVGLLDETLHMAMDWDLIVRVALNFEVHFFPKVLSYFRKHSLAKTSVTLTGFGPEMLLVLNKIFLNKNLMYGMRLIRNYAYCSVYLVCVRGYIKANQKKQARVSLLKAFLHDPILCLHKSRNYLFLLKPPF